MCYRDTKYDHLSGQEAYPRYKCKTFIKNQIVIKQKIVHRDNAL